MKRLCTTVAILALSGGLALAQGGGGGGGGSGGSAGSAGGAAGASSGGGAAATGATGSQRGVAAAAERRRLLGRSGIAGEWPEQHRRPGARAFRPRSHPTISTVGRAPGVNPANPQDASRRGNPSDRSLPGARNPQDMKAFDNGMPQIINAGGEAANPIRVPDRPSGRFVRLWRGSPGRVRTYRPDG